MSRTHWIMKLAIGVVLAGAATPALVFGANDSKPETQANAPTVTYQSVDEPVHHVRIDGDSNLVKWHATGRRINGSVDVPAVWRGQGEERRLEPDLTAGASSHAGRASIPVLEIRGDEEGLSKRMHEAMNAYKHQQITFALTEVKSVSALSQPGGARWDVRGNLTVSGVTRETELTLTVIPQTNDRIQIELKKPLKMSDFKINPPRALGGFVRAHDDLDIEIRWLLERKDP
jgi:hypothetical protein